MERFVQAVVAGGVALVAGLWIATWFDALTVPWGVGALLVLGGVVGLGWGIRSQIEFEAT